MTVPAGTDMPARVRNEEPNGPTSSGPDVVVTQYTGARLLHNEGGGKFRDVTEAAGEPVEYRGYTIRPAPQKQASGWNTAGVISKSFADGEKEHRRA